MILRSCLCKKFKRYFIFMKETLLLKCVNSVVWHINRDEEVSMCLCLSKFPEQLVAQRANNIYMSRLPHTAQHIHFVASTSVVKCSI